MDEICLGCVCDIVHLGTVLLSSLNKMTHSSFYAFEKKKKNEAFTASFPWQTNLAILISHILPLQVPDGVATD